jgi:SSS family solute:Na+ symporter
MAFMGVLLGLFARVGFENEVFAWAKASQIDSEMGLPLLLKSVLPIGLTGLMMSAYFSAILSTADSCLMAASGNFVTDLIGKVVRLSEKWELRFSQITTLIIGAAAVIIALAMENVLELMLLSYAFMVSGLLIPVLMAWYTKKPNYNAAFVAMLAGGTLTAGLELIKKFGPNSASDSSLRGIYAFLNENIFSIGLDANLYGISISLILYVLIASLSNKQQYEPTYG